MRYEVSDLRAHLVNVDRLEETIRDVVVSLVNYIFADGPPPDPYGSSDAHCSGSIDIDDVVYLIQYMFAGGNAPCDHDGDGCRTAEMTTGSRYTLLHRVGW